MDKSDYFIAIKKLFVSREELDAEVTTELFSVVQNESERSIE